MFVALFKPMLKYTWWPRNDMLRGCAEALVNVFYQPAVFFEESQPWKRGLGYNVFLAALISLASAAFRAVYFSVYSQAGWLGVGVVFADVLLQPALVGVSVLFWAALMNAVLWYFEIASLADAVSITAYAWLVTYPYYLVNTLLYIVQTAFVTSQSSWAAFGVVGASLVASVASIIHVVTATVIGLKARLDTSWWQGVIAAAVVPLSVLLLVVALAYAATIL